MFRSFLICLFFLFITSSFGWSLSVDSLLLKTYNAMHDDCMSGEYINDDIAKAVFLDVDIVKAMELLKNRNIMDFSERYIDPKLVARKKQELLERYQLLDGFLDLKGRGFLYEDLCNAYLATQLMAYRYLYLSAANYGIVPEKTWKSIRPDTWRLKISFGDKFENFYFRRDGLNWYLTEREFIESGDLGN